MNLVCIGKRTLNLDLVALYEEGTAAPEGETRVSNCMTVVLTSGANLAFFGAEALAIRAFLVENSRPLTSPLPDDDGGYASNRSALLPKPDRREEGR